MGATWQQCRVHFMQNALSYVPKAQNTVVAAAIRLVFLQPDQKAVTQGWRQVADQLRTCWPKLGTYMDEAETDVLAYTGLPTQHRTELHSIHPPERLNKEGKRADVVGIFPNEDSIVWLVGAVLLEQNDEYGPPPSCKAFLLILTKTGLAVVYPALLCGFTHRRPLWFPRIDGWTNGRTQNRSHLFIGLCRSPVRPVRHTVVFASQVGPRKDRTDYAANGCAP